jgi:hypothetical protein
MNPPQQSKSPANSNDDPARWKKFFSLNLNKLKKSPSATASTIKTQQGVGNRKANGTGKLFNTNSEMLKQHSFSNSIMLSGTFKLKSSLKDKTVSLFS